jgi:membrane protease YdiL (CAAX protease family)
MENNFINSSKIGKNEWWRFVLTILVTVITIFLTNSLIRQILPSIKKLFPENEFGKDLGTYSLVLLIFGVALLAFIVAVSKFHRRPIISFISEGKKFSFKYYFIGFISWAILLFLGNLITDFGTFKSFLHNFNPKQFWFLLLFGFFAIGIQSFFEEIVIRGYLLQSLHLRIKNFLILILFNALIFGILHIGYGIGSFLSSWFFGIAFAIIVILQKRIEFVSGAHNANNLLLALIFLDLTDASKEKFSWTINWTEFGLQIIALLLLVGVAFKSLKK